ncbi:unnamed protein product [Protopolystoma xenopodis]|uniref:Uncharacterized protein n=1 Tax=Protopolystoma xenopodis TaxID=117903 RepID=A0A3S5CBH5_9PLAT|nr:unnamed protein product [Protopolystoma xenopodis]
MVAHELRRCYARLRFNLSRNKNSRSSITHHLIRSTGRFSMAIIPPNELAKEEINLRQTIQHSPSLQFDPSPSKSSRLIPISEFSSKQMIPPNSRASRRATNSEIVGISPIAANITVTTFILPLEGSEINSITNFNSKAKEFNESEAELGDFSNAHLNRQNWNIVTETTNTASRNGRTSEGTVFLSNNNLSKNETYPKPGVDQATNFTTAYSDAEIL